MNRIAIRFLTFSLVTLSQKLLAFLLTMQLFSLMSPESYGNYIYFVNLINLGATFILLGFPTLLTREISKYRALETNPQLVGIIRFSVFAVGATLLVSLILAMSFCFAICSNTSEVRWSFGVALVGFIAITFCGIQQGLLRGYERAVASAWPLMLAQPLIVLVFAVTARLFDWQVTSLESLTAFSVGAVTASLLMQAMISSNLTVSDILTKDYSYDVRNWIGSLLPFFLIGGFTILIYRADVIILGIFRDSAEVGRYSIVAQLSMLTILPGAIVGLLIEPRISVAYARGRQGAIKKYYWYSAIASAGIASGFLFFSCLFGVTILDWLFDIKEQEIFLSFIILTFGFSIYTALGPADTFLGMTGHEKDSMMSLGAGTLANIAMNLLLIPTYGAIGAAISTAVTLVGSKALMLKAIKTRRLF